MVEFLTKEFLKQKYIVGSLSISQIAKLVGHSPSFVWKHFKIYNIPRRTRSEALKGKFTGKNSSMYGKHHGEQAKKKMLEATRGENHSNWKGGRCKQNGYVLIYSPTHPHKIEGNYVLEHRLVVEKILGRYLLPTEPVHHINGVRDDNRPKNLIAFINQSAHLRFHKDPNNVNSNEIIFDGRKIKIIK